MENGISVLLNIQWDVASFVFRTLADAVSALNPKSNYDVNG